MTSAPRLNIVGARALPGRLVAAVVVAVVTVASSVVGQVTGHAQAVPAGGSWELTDALSVPRYDHTLTLLADGRVLAAAGRTLNVTPGVVFRTAEVYDPIAEEWNPTGSLNQARFMHTATLLPDGRVLVAGGFGEPYPNPNPSVLDTAEIYDPATGTWTPTGTMNVRRGIHQAALLADGRVLVAGGRTCNGPPPATCTNVFRTATAEIYDPATGTWTLTGSMSGERYNAEAAVLLDGRVLVPAGFTSTTPNGSNTADLYDPATGTWSRTGNLNQGRSRAGAIRLNDGRVMVMLGFRGPAIPNPTTEIYDPATNRWTFADNIDFPFSRFNFSYGLLPNGKVVLAGGQFFAGQANQGIVRDSHIYDPVTNDWTNTAPLNEPHGTPGGLSDSEKMVILSASPTSYVADPRVCGRHCGKAMVAGNSITGSTELFTAAGTCYGFDATITAPAAGGAVAGTEGRDVILGSPADDRIAALGGDDVICGGGGNDQISGGRGGDVTLAGDGLDRVAAGEGDDFLFGEVADDQLSGGRGLDTADGWVGTDACLAEVVRRCP
ncbi:MAG TPA: kelch repeat-containing protein [Acidimicrobiales bacterium]|nr:kelch repeat-containing protein [Acidimicrobiales bacterium]